MRILVIGSGGREHALLRALSVSLQPDNPQSHPNDVHVAPGNAGMEGLAVVHDTYDGQPISVTDGEQIAALARHIGAELVVIGPEIPLVAGVADVLRGEGIPVCGPSAAAARIEGSKVFAKDVMNAAGVRTARSVSVDPRCGENAVNAQIDAALDSFSDQEQFVVKDDGLAAGKGVVVTPERNVARAHAQAIVAQGNPVIFESFLEGPEVSLFCLVDGETVVPLLPAQDHKRAYDGDAGPNTGGMGAYAPLPWLPEDAASRIVEECVRPVARELMRRGTPYSGVLYAGIAWGAHGPAVVEFNCRFGDPETQAVLSLLRTPLASLLFDVATHHLSEERSVEWEDGYAVVVVLAAEGYPEAPHTGGVICGAEGDPLVFHAGTARREDGNIVSAGGRVLSVVGRGATLEEARAEAYRRVEAIAAQSDGVFYRSDIALKALHGQITVPQ